MVRKSCVKDWWVYVLACHGGTFYTGISNDVLRRVDDHNRGRGAKYTRGRTPVVLWWEDGPFTRSEALKKEAAIKRLPRIKKDALKYL